MVVMITLTLTAAASVRGEEGPPQPVRAVATALEMSESQVASWLTILVQRDAALQPLMQQMQQRHQALGEALSSPVPDAALVGQLVIEIKAIERAANSIRAEANSALAGILTEEQRGRLGQMIGAAQVCPIVPALQAVGLI
jgi:Spy/CpxP family protein refolding chaperone